MPKESDTTNNWGIIGHSKITSYLLGSIKNGNVAHAYLFTGPKSVGKATVARKYTQSLICDNRDNNPCGDCKSCKMFLVNSHPDFVFVDRELNEKTGKLKKNISIEQVRKLQERLNLSSLSEGRYKCVVIDDAETLSLEAANALLKTLEEPSGRTVLILLTHSKSKLPLTIVSRCQTINFLPVNTKELFDHLSTMKLERKKADSLSNLSFGCPGIALQMLSDSERYQDFLGNIRQFVELLNSNTIKRFKIVGSLATSLDIDDVKNILSLWTISVRDLILINNQMSNLISSPALLSDLEKVSGKFDNKKLINITNKINESKIYLDANTNPRLTLENLVLNF